MVFLFILESRYRIAGIPLPVKSFFQKKKPLPSPVEGGKGLRISAPES
jgi:hypothetical protein